MKIDLTREELAAIIGLVEMSSDSTAFLIKYLESSEDKNSKELCGVFIEAIKSLKIKVQESLNEQVEIEGILK
jgi:hypothetical protein